MMHLEAIIKRNKAYSDWYVEEPSAPPVGYVEVLPGKTPRRKKAKDVVKIGWGSERVNRRTKK